MDGDHNDDEGNDGADDEDLTPIDHAELEKVLDPLIKQLISVYGGASSPANSGRRFGYWR